MSDLPTYEKLGAFYLGREKGDDGSLGQDLLYDAKDLTTHGMIVGMTGSGKTGLALGLVEEAAMDGVPAILIDPKGDLANLMLRFPEFRPEDFRPWIDPEEARRKGMSVDDLTEKTAESWKKGLGKWGQDGDRLRRLARAADFEVYTPGDTAGRPLNVLGSFDAPRGLDDTAFRDRVLYAVSGLLGFVGMDADAAQSVEHTFLSTLFETEWRAGRSLSLERVILSVQNPPFAKVGVFDVESFYPQKERMKLATKLNSLLASPGFAAWRSGEPLNVPDLLRNSNGKPKVSVLSIAHLNDSERMFFVTSLLNEVLTWMRRQTGTGSLRALLYMDEIFGYFPPNGMPPSKSIMLTLLKQARAFGLGIVLSTQNPVDLDYKGLSNCGTWWIGRLQTERDRMRVLDGLAGAAENASAAFPRAETAKLISGLGNRTFLMRNVHDDVPVLFETRWVMSYMAGPLTLPQLRSLVTRPEIPAAPECPAEPMPWERDYDGGTSAPAPASSRTAPAPAPAPASAPAPVLALPAWAKEYVKKGEGCGAWIPRAFGRVKLHFVSATANLDVWVERAFVADLGNDGAADWEEADILPWDEAGMSAGKRPDGPLETEPLAALTPKTESAWKKAVAAAAYQTQKMEQYVYEPLKLKSRGEESEADFRQRVSLADRERVDADKAKLTEKHKTDRKRLETKIATAEARVEREKDARRSSILSGLASAAGAVVGMLFGRRSGSGITTSATRAGSVIRSTGQTAKKAGDVRRAADSLEALQADLETLDAEFAEAVEAIRPAVLPQDAELVVKAVTPRKTDISVKELGVCWTR